jgi:WbqC-like protein family
MKVAIMQPYFLPYLGYFQLIKAVDLFVVYDDVNYIKKGWVNRNNILVNGQPYLFSIALKAMSQNKLINEIAIDEASNWNKNLVKTIELSYKKAPFFNTVFPLIEDILQHDEKNLASFITYSLQQICQYLKIETTIAVSSTIEKDNTLKGTDKIIEICKKTNATNYINASGGKELYDKADFTKHNIDLHFIQSKKIKYPQFANEFVPWLSIVDVMMFNSADDIQNLLQQQELV